jgi:hypothetical protein
VPTRPRVATRLKRSQCGAETVPYRGLILYSGCRTETERKAFLTVQEVFESAHRSAAELAPAELASELQAVLGQKLVAFALGDRHPKTIGRYARDDRKPDDATLRQLVDLHTIVGVLETGMRRQAVKSWMLGANPHLRSRAPIEVFHDGHTRDVMRAARRFVSPR